MVINMEKINIADLLKDCPKGMELNSPIFGKVYLDKIRPHLSIVVTTDKEHGDFKEEFLYDGRYGMNGECMLFPSKGKTTWEGFVPPCQFKDGDILYLKAISDWVCIYKEDKDTKNFYIYVAIEVSSADNIVYNKARLLCCKKDIIKIRIATEEAKQKLFNAIKANGYKWNAETKTLEKLIEPRFTAGDTIKNKNDKWQAERTIQSYVAGIGYFTTIHDWIHLEEQDDWELIPNKFDINTLIPFESKVLVRADNCNLWKPALFGFVNSGAFYIVGGNTYRQCIPYEANKELLGTTNDCDDFYKLERNER